MRYEPRELVKLTAGVLISAAATRYTWKRLRAQDASQTSGRKVSLPAAKKKKVELEEQAGDSLPGGGFCVYYGSQTGTAESFSKELEQEAPGQGLRAAVLDMEDFDPERLARHGVVVLVVATYGEGDPTDNAAGFFRWIQDESLGPDTLQGVTYCVMGLGSRQYAHFNACGRLADEHMQRLGATRIYRRGEGDDSRNIQVDFEQWKEDGLWPALRQAAGVGNRPQTPAGAKTPQVSARELLSGLALRVEVRGDAEQLPANPLVQAGGADDLGRW